MNYNCNFVRWLSMPYNIMEWPISHGGNGWGDQNAFKLLFVLPSKLENWCSMRSSDSIYLLTVPPGLCVVFVCTRVVFGWGRLGGFPAWGPVYPRWGLCPFPRWKYRKFSPYLPYTVANRRYLGNFSFFGKAGKHQKHTTGKVYVLGAIFE